MCSILSVVGEHLFTILILFLSFLSRSNCVVIIFLDQTLESSISCLFKSLDDKSHAHSAFLHVFIEFGARPILHFKFYAHIETARKFHLAVCYCAACSTVELVGRVLFHLHNSCMVQVSGIRLHGGVSGIHYGNLDYPRL